MKFITHIYIYIYMSNRRTERKKKCFNRVHQIVREEEIRSAAQIHRAGRSSFELERLRGRSSESYAGSCELDKHVPQLVVPWIRLDSCRHDFSIIPRIYYKGNERVLEKILSPRSNTRCRWRGPRDHRNRFDNAADWLGDGVRVARVYFSKKCISARQRGGGECWCRCYSSPPSNWTRQTNQTAAHFQGHFTGSRYTPTRTINRRWEEQEKEEERTG